MVSAERTLARLGVAGVLVGSALTAYAWRESMNLELTHTVVPIDGLPTGLHGLRILHIADTHFPANARSLPRFRRAIERLQYDIVLATGDYAETARGWPTVVDAFRDLDPRLGCYAVIGGHERYAAPRSPRDVVKHLRALFDPTARRFIDPMPLVEELRTLGVRVLINESVSLEIGGEAVRLIGIDDAALGRDDLPAALPANPQGRFEILLSHSPDGVLHPRARRIPFALSGHTHGGQIRLPGYGAPVRHARAVTRRQPAGLMRIGATQTYVSRGFGTSAIPLRLGARPELGVIELRTAEPAGKARVV